MSKENVFKQKMIFSCNGLSEKERKQILYDFNNTKTEYPRDKVIHELFEEQVEKTPDKIALVGSNNRLSYREVNHRANQIAEYLREKGVTRNNAVGIMAERSVEMIIGILAVLKAGGAYLPINGKTPKERVKYMLNDSGAKVLLSYGFTDVEVGGGIEIIDIEREEGLRNRSGRNVENVNSSRDVAYIMYTSGTTGNPKGVMVEHKNVIRLIRNTNYITFSEDDKILQTGSVAFDATTFEIWGALLNGLSLYIVEEDILLNSEKLERKLKENGITILLLTSSLFNQLLTQKEELFDGLKYLLIGGDVLSVKHINKLRRRNRGINIVNVYGPTENATFSACFQIDKEYETNIPIGKPISNSTAYILDKDYKIQPIGMIGELFVGGEGVARGYINNEELTQEKFLENPLYPGERLYRTGDLARWLPDGNIEFLGRIDQQVKIRGYRIELGEIESKLLKNPCIQETMVIAREDKSGVKHLCAYVVLEKEMTVHEIRKHLKKELPDYMIPSYFVPLERIPLTINGKVDKNALPEPEGYIRTSAEYEEASNEIEGMLVNLWREVLKIEQIGVNDDFFELGGNSLNALVIMSRMSTLGYSITLTDINYYKTIKALSRYLYSKQEKKNLIESKEEVLAYLHRETGIVFEWGKYLVKEHGNKIKEVNILYSNFSPEVSVDNIVKLIRHRVSNKLAPHYILPMYKKVQLNDQEVIDEETFYKRLGLKDFEEEQTVQIMKALEEDYKKKDQWVKGGLVLESYNLSSIQQMQILFDTPADMAELQMDAYIDVDCLEKAYIGLVKSQGLLRSVPVREESCILWKEYEYNTQNFPGLFVIDLTDYNLTEVSFAEVLEKMMNQIRFLGENILQQPLLVKRNMREHYFVILFHHVIFDRVSNEIVIRQLLNYYNSLCKNEKEELEDVKPYADYVKQIQGGPKNITEQELITKYYLEEFYSSKKDIIDIMDKRKSGLTYLFTINVPTKNLSLEFALSVYIKGMQRYIGINKLPLLFVYEGRQYETESYYNTIGEFIDFVPFLLDSDMSPQEMLKSVKKRLDDLKRYNINFLNLLLNPELKNSWSRARKFAHFGENFETIDILMFNYLGNPNNDEQTLPDDKVEIVPNLLPIHSLFNCIASSYKDGLSFSMRCSYDIDVEELKKIFLEVAKELS